MRVTLFRDHPAEGWPSMDRYADSLLGALQELVRPGWNLRMPMPPAPLPGTYGRLLTRLLRYPLWARGQQGALNHIVDHSYGHLLFTLDPARTLVTVHDIAPLHFPGRRGGLSSLAWLLAWRGIRRARHIIADSAATAAELQNHVSLDLANFYVIPLAVAPGFRPRPPESAECLRRRYLPPGGRLLLHIGHTQPRKNLPALLQALALLNQQGWPAHLIQVGGRPDPAQQQLIRDLGLEQSVHFVGYVPDEALPDFYSAAELLVFPSLYEGFGLPLLEAMACGTPVVCSDLAVFREVCGPAALYADPGDPAAFAAALARVLDTPSLAAELRELGHARARLFTWERTARETLAVYRQMMAEVA